jgi:HPt (histidine-containing phosphotransfer) domain-containing protein
MTDQEKPIVELSQLRDLIGDDKELEQTLISLFLTSSVDDLSYLENNCKDGEDEEWKRHAHSLKGSSRNIGAFGMGDLCSKGQDSYNVSAAEKKELYLQIQAEFDKVKDFLSKV